MSLLSRAANRLAETVLCLLAGAVIVAAIGPISGLWHYEVIESGSMTPTLRVGGVAIVVPEPTSAVGVGQVLAFHPPGMTSYVRIHRVIAVTHRGDQVWIRTKGDANRTADPGPVRLKGQTAYVERDFVPYVGYAGVWLYRHSTRTALEGALFVLVVACGLWLIWAREEELTEERDPVPLSPARRHWAFRSKPAPSPAAVAITAEKAATASLVALNHAYAGSSEERTEASSRADGPQRVAQLGP